MKWVGLILALAGGWWFYIWRFDPCEGLYMRAVGILAMVAGACLYFEGLKREIISVFRRQSRD